MFKRLEARSNQLTPQSRSPHFDVMPAPLQTLEEQVEYLSVQRDAGCTPEELEFLATASKDSFLSVLADVDEVQRVHATTMIRMLMSSVFTMAHRSEIMRAINSKVGVRMVNQTHARQALQSFMHFHNYPTKDLIAVMSDPAISYHPLSKRWEIS